MTQRYTAYTLVDITESGITNSKTEDTLGYNQQQNLNTLIQLIGLRSQPMQYTITILKTQDVAEYNFGTVFKGLHTVWKFEFVSEHTGVFEYNDNETHFLTHDCDGAAFTHQLQETVEFTAPVFQTTNKNLKNLYFKKHQ